MASRKRRPSFKELLPLAPRVRVAAGVPTGEAFRAEWIDFDRGIRVGNLEPHERITQILKHRLQEAHGIPFVTDRWGRGTYWQWICWLSRPNREAKPLSSSVNFGCAKFFIAADRGAREFQCGLQVERGFTDASAAVPGCVLAGDWDWKRLMKHCADGTDLDRELRRLILREGFTARIGDWRKPAVFTKANFSSAAQLRAATRGVRRDRWAGFALFYSMPEAELRATGGYELVQAVCGAFAETAASMNLCMQVPLRGVGRGARFGGFQPDLSRPRRG
jgi:hypothetical protein